MCCATGFYAESPDDGDNGRGTCDGPCVLHDSYIGEPSVCNVQRDHRKQASSADDHPLSGTGTATLDDWPLTMSSSSGAIVSGTVLGRCCLLLALVASLPTQRCAVILLDLLFFSISCLQRVILTCCLPAIFVNR